MDIVGRRFKSKQCGWFTVLDKFKKENGNYKYLCEFDSVNSISYRTYSERRHVISGGIKNPYYPLKLGIACVGNVNSKRYPKEFNKWRAMIERCYDPQNNHYGNYGERGVRVCKRWLCFEYFLDDLSKLEGYDKVKLNAGKLHLDKDIKGNGKLYSLKTCILISPEDNVMEMNQRTKQKTFVATRISDGNQIIGYNQTDFAKSIGLDQSNISKCLNGFQKSFGGYTIKLFEGDGE